MAPLIREQALKNALASSKIEGYSVTAEVQKNCQRLINGEVSAQQIALEVLKKHREGKRV